MDTSPVRLEFPFTFADRLKAGLAVTASCWGCLAGTLVLPAGGLALLATSFRAGGPTFDVVLGAFMLVVVPVIIVWNTWQAHKAFADTHAHAYLITEQGVRGCSAHTEIAHDWATIRSVQVRYGFLMLSFSKQGAHCIPLRWLDSAQIERVACFAKSGQVRRVDV